jgi:DNA-binding winged helix-turn-helix (wHTH) protein
VAESNIVDRHIRSLRIKLQNDYRHPRFIATVPGEGYRFVPTFSNTGWGRAWAFVDPGFGVLGRLARQQDRPS